MCRGRNTPFKPCHRHSYLWHDPPCDKVFSDLFRRGFLSTYLSLAKWCASWATTVCKHIPKPFPLYPLTPLTQRDECFSKLFCIPSICACEWGRETCGWPRYLYHSGNEATKKWCCSNRSIRIDEVCRPKMSVTRTRHSTDRAFFRLRAEISSKRTNSTEAVHRIPYLSGSSVFLVLVFNSPWHNIKEARQQHVHTQKVLVLGIPRPICAFK